jgi:hypothetical protein
MLDNKFNQLYFQRKSENPKSQSTRRSSLPGPWYLLKTETVGVQNCPVHGGGEREGGKENKARNVFYIRFSYSFNKYSL